MKPRAHEDDDDELAGDLQVGSAASGVEPETEHPAAVLWVPDPTTRRGWCEYFVKKQPKPGRPLGFRKRRS